MVKLFPKSSHGEARDLSKSSLATLQCPTRSAQVRTCASNMTSSSAMRCSMISAFVVVESLRQRTNHAYRGYYQSTKLPPHAHARLLSSFHFLEFGRRHLEIGDQLVGNRLIVELRRRSHMRRCSRRRAGRSIRFDGVRPRANRRRTQRPAALFVRVVVCSDASGGHDGGSAGAAGTRLAPGRPTATLQLHDAHFLVKQPLPEADEREEFLHSTCMSRCLSHTTTAIPPPHLRCSSKAP